MYSKAARTRLQTNTPTPHHDRRVTSLQQRRAAELEAGRAEVAVLTLQAYWQRKPQVDRRPLWLRSLEAGKQLKGAR